MIPQSDVDIYSDAALVAPYPNYKAFRDLAPIVHLTKSNLFAISRYADVRDALSNWEVFSSAQGVGASEAFNRMQVGSTVGSDPPEHDRLRKILARPLSPQALSGLNQRITEEAEALVTAVCERGHFDAVVDFAQHLPLSIVANLIGLPDERRHQMLRWAAAGFDCMGAENERTRVSAGIVQEFFDYARGSLSPDQFKPGGWAAQLFEAAARGELDIQQAAILMNDYVGPSLDTTISATTSAIWLFATHPNQWEDLRANHRLIPDAINEVVRLESPIQGFTRVLRRDHLIGDLRLDAGARALILYGSANRDERRWQNPEQFNIHRREGEHVGFGHGVHRCIGANLARMEIAALLKALIPRVEAFTVLDAERAPNSVIRAWAHLNVSVLRARR